MRKTEKIKLVFRRIERIAAIFMMGILLSGMVSCGSRSHAELTELTQEESLENTGESTADAGDVEEAGTANKTEDGTANDTGIGITNGVGNDAASDSGMGGDVIYVHVCGAVKVPGVYCVKAGSRLYEVIEAAGGLNEDACEEALNQAAPAEDGQQVYVLTKEEAKERKLTGADTMASDGTASAGAASSGTTASDGVAEDDGKISINTADKAQLMTLTGIGEAKATAIIQYRESHGAFQDLEELMQIEGIKEGVFSKIKDQIKL
jgi:competence protein ComEA